MAPARVLPAEVDPVTSPRRARWQSVARWIGVAIVYLGASVFFTWPLVEFWRTHLLAPFRFEDMVLDIWILRWVMHALSTDPSRLFDANVFHPAPQSLAFSEHLIGLVPFYGGAWLLTKNPVFSLNLVIFGSYVAGGLTTHWVVWRWTRDHRAAFVAGLAYAFAPWRLITAYWPHGLWSPFLPLIVYGLERIGRTGSGRAAVLTAGWITLQMLSSYYLAYMALLVVGCCLLGDLVARGLRHRAPALRGFVIALAIPAVALGLVSLPYLAQRATGVLAWTWPTTTSQNHIWYDDSASIAQFAGWPAAIPALGWMFWAARRWRSSCEDERARPLVLGLIFVTGLMIARGPDLSSQARPSLYSVAAAVVPGFAMVRVPGRFGIVVGLALSLAAGLGVAAAAASVRREHRRLASLTATALILWVLQFSSASLRDFPAPLMPQLLPVGFGVPPAYHWLAAHGEGAPLLDLQEASGPGSDGNLTWRGDTLAMYFSTYHWLPLLNGYSGYTPPSYGWVQEQVRHLTTPGTALRLRRCTGLRWILVHSPRSDLRSEWDAIPGLRLVGVFPNLYGMEEWLYEIEDDACGECPIDPETIRTYRAEGRLTRSQPLAPTGHT